MSSQMKSSRTPPNGMMVVSDLHENLSDSDLITRLRQCSEQEKTDILLTLYERYKLLVLKICFHYLADYDQANDLLHDAFIRVIEKAEKLENPAVFKSWLLTVTRNLCVDRIRKKTLTDDQESLTTRIDLLADRRIEDRYIAEIDRDKILGHLYDCLRNLDESLLTILKLRCQGLRATQISKIVCMDRTQLRRSYDKIKRRVESHMRSKGIKIRIDQIISLGGN